MGEIEASHLDCDPWSADRFRKALATARSLTREPDPGVWYPALVEECARAGVCLVVTPEIEGARTHGATRWLRTDRALIQLSLRYRWSDIFWSRSSTKPSTSSTDQGVPSTSSSKTATRTIGPKRNARQTPSPPTS